MKVLTLNNTDFINHCTRLEEKVRASFAPDAILAIANGGVRVAENMFKDLPHFIVESHRPSTKKKESMGTTMRIIRRLPLWVKNGLRIAEATILSLKKHKIAELPDFNPDILSDYENILIVDDSVDSGMTLTGVQEVLSRGSARHNVRAAVITVTTSKPLSVPDYTLYNNHILIRFPWSKDNLPEK